MSRRLLTVHLAALLGFSTATPAFADGPAPGTHVYQSAPRAASRPSASAATSISMNGQVARVVLTADQTAATLELAKGKSAIVELPSDVRDLLVTSPAVADAVLRDRRRVYIVGLAEGVTDAAFFDEAGRRILSLSIKVSQPIDQLADTLSRVLPDAKIEVRPIRDSVVLSGLVRTPAQSEAAARIAAQYVGGADKVLNMLSIAGKDQVMLQVRIVEVQRNVIKQLGVSTDNLLNDGFKSYTVGRGETFAVNGGQVGGGGACYGRDNIRKNNLSTSSNSSSQTSTNTSTGVPGNGTSSAVTDALTSAASSAWSTATGNSLSACLSAFERVGLVRTLAEPNLTAVSGEAGHFLVGGEFPVPTGSDTSGRISIEFKPYGVGLGYTPVVMSGGRISLKLSTEVSELSSMGAFTLSNGSASRSLTVPGLSVRRAETTVELPSGGSLMIAGLLQQTSRQAIDSLPGMTNMPILGSLFRSRDFLSGETELVIIVTPYIVDPTKPKILQTPADGLSLAGDMSTVLLGRLNQVVKAPPGANAGRAYQGPVGYVIE